MQQVLCATWIVWSKKSQYMENERPIIFFAMPSATEVSILRHPPYIPIRLERAYLSLRALTLSRLLGIRSWGVECEGAKGYLDSRILVRSYEGERHDRGRKEGWRDRGMGEPLSWFSWASSERQRSILIWPSRVVRAITCHRASHPHL